MLYDISDVELHTGAALFTASIHFDASQEHL